MSEIKADELQHIAYMQTLDGKGWKNEAAIQ